MSIGNQTQELYGSPSSIQTDAIIEEVSTTCSSPSAHLLTVASALPLALATSRRLINVRYTILQMNLEEDH